MHLLSAYIGCWCVWLADVLAEGGVGVLADGEWTTWKQFVSNRLKRSSELRDQTAFVFTQMSNANLHVDWLVFLHLLPIQGKCIVTFFSEGLVTVVIPVGASVVPSQLIFTVNLALLWSSQASTRQGSWWRKGGTIPALYVWRVWFGTATERRGVGGLF